MKIPETAYYSPNKLLSYNYLLSFVCGGRGIGKTFGFSRYVANRFIKRGEQFIYLRRFKPEIKKGMRDFFDPLYKNLPDEFKDIDMVSKPNNTFEINGQIAGYGMALSTYLQNKSSNFPDVTTVLFDEFLLPKKSNLQYLPDEMMAFLNMLDTIFRNRDNCRCICLSNAMSIVNPYFTFFKAQPNENHEFYKNDKIVIEFPDSTKFANYRRQTKFGQLVSGTRYDDFAIGNKFMDDNETFIERKSKMARYLFNIAYESTTMGVWIDYNAGHVYVSNKFDPTGRTYSLSRKDHRPNMLLLNNYRHDRNLNLLIRSFQNGSLCFDNQVIKNTMYDLFAQMNIK